MPTFGDAGEQDRSKRTRLIERFPGLNLCVGYTTGAAAVDAPSYRTISTPHKSEMSTATFAKASSGTTMGSRASGSEIGGGPGSIREGLPAKHLVEEVSHGQ
jgi:hypothetical protein